MDETYIRLKDLYRAIDKKGNTIDFLFRAKRDTVATKAFFRKVFKQNVRPDEVAIDKSIRNKADLGERNKHVSKEKKIEIR